MSEAIFSNLELKSSVSKKNFIFNTDGQETARIAQQVDWSKHPLGPIESWPAALKINLGTIFNSRHPMCIFWGEHCYYFYNDGYIPILGEDKHPLSMGKRGQEVWSEVWPMLRPQVDLVMSRGKATWNVDHMVPIRRGGEQQESYFTYSYSPIFSEEGIISGTLVTCTETTGRVVAERALSLAIMRAENSKQELFDFFMQAPAPLVILLGEDHRFALANPLYEQFVGRKVVGKKLLEVFRAEEVADFVKLLDKVYSTGEPFVGSELPLNIKDPNGILQNRFINIAYHPFREQDGTIKGILAFHQDVTEQILARKSLEKTAEDLKSAISSRDEFLSIASHELKTPLTSLKLQSQLLERIAKKGNREYFTLDRLMEISQQTDHQVSRLARLVDDMLDISRIRSAKLNLKRETFDFSQLVKDVVQRLKPIFVAAKSQSPEIVSSDRAVGSWDRNRLEQVVINLLTNALRYGEGKAVHIRVEVTENRAIFSVCDHGLGISKENHEKIFNRFERAVSANDISGLGLGLYITKKIVDAHDGHVWVESEYGTGSTFFVELPLGLPPEPVTKPR